MNYRNLLTIGLLLGTCCATYGLEPLDEPPPPMHEDSMALDQPPMDQMNHVERLLRRMERRDPEEAQRLRQLQEEDPAAFHDELKSLLEKKRGHQRGDDQGDAFRRMPKHQRKGFMDKGPRHNPEVAALRKDIQALVQSYHKADDATAQTELKTELRVKLETAFDLKESIRKEHIARIASELTKAQEALQEREANRDAIIDRRLLELTEGDPLKW